MCSVTSLVASRENGGVKFEMINLNSRAIWFENEQLGESLYHCTGTGEQCPFICCMEFTIWLGMYCPHIDSIMMLATEPTVNVITYSFNIMQVYH